MGKLWAHYRQIMGTLQANYGHIIGNLWAHYKQISFHSDSRANELERIWKCLWSNRGIILDFTWKDPLRKAEDQTEA